MLMLSPGASPRMGNAPCFYRARQGMSRLASVLAFLGLWVSDISLAHNPRSRSAELTGEFERDEPGRNKTKCTVEDLLPLPSPGEPVEWTEEDIAPSYNCTCASMKSRYFCPSADNSGYPVRVPRAVFEEKCTSTTRSEMVEAPLPVNFRVLVYGNSHLRQVVEATACMFEKALASKRVMLASPTLEAVPGDFQCRGCFNGKYPEANIRVKSKLMDQGCITETDTCRCHDDRAEFDFENGATVHYTFSHVQKNKSIDDARYGHANKTLSLYDAVIANPGNGRRMTETSVLEMAQELQDAGVPLFWLSTYDGVGDVTTWDEEYRERFIASGAHFVPIGDMVRGMEAWTVGFVEGSHSDEHFCLPGPPDEIALLMLKLMWAVYEEKK